MGRTETKTMHLKEIDVQQMRRTMSNQQIADFYGIKLNALYKWCYRHNVITIRLTDWELAEGIGTKTAKELAYEYHLTRKTIYNRLSKLGICPRQPGQKGGRK